MTSPAFPFPNSKPLYEVHVYDGLTIDAESWRNERYYHQHRQNIHYQSLHEPGIVSGLGVRILSQEELDEILPNRLRTEELGKIDRWVEIEPGIAIDIEGNPIVIPREPRENRCFSLQNPRDLEDGEAIVYLYVSFNKKTADTPHEKSDKYFDSQPKEPLLQESFGIDLQTQPLTGKEIELCRLRLQARNNELSIPADFLNPQINELDFRYRRSAQIRPLKTIRVGVLENQTLEANFKGKEVEREVSSFQDLMTALDALYPKLYGIPEIDRILMLSERHFQVRSLDAAGLWSNISSQTSEEVAQFYDVLYLGSSWQQTSLSEDNIHLLKNYIQAGGMIWLEIPQNLETIPILLSIENLQDSRLSLDNDNWKTLDTQHPARTQPFAFQDLPEGEASRFIQLQEWGNIFLCEGQLSLAWGASFYLTLDRAEVRACQELGINILNYIWQRRQMQRLSNW
ncbi:hypothetical protein [Baaleninema simplex]|uniref:hypothetical protein n=1 Tax=Baaleninema simplex TaxID=2862350 RepID=UPI000345FFEA|nr:hypothetical protein [Baaleninema simplex]